MSRAYFRHETYERWQVLCFFYSLLKVVNEEFALIKLCFLNDEFANAFATIYKVYFTFIIYFKLHGIYSN